MSSARESTRRRRRRKRWVIVWTTAAVIVSVCASALPFLDVRGIAAVPVAQALVPIGAVVLILLGITSLIFRAWMAALFFFAGAVISGVPAMTPLHVEQQCETDRRLTVLSFNAKLSGADPDALSNLIRTTEPDFVILFETDETLIDAVLDDDDLARELPHRTREVSEGAANGSVILSFHPLSLEEDIGGSEFDQITAVATLPGGVTVRVAALHPPPPVWQPNGWYAAIDDIGSWAQHKPDARLIMAGDFNASFAHPVFRRMVSGLRTAAEAAGPLPWATWPEGKPIPAFTAIDHILARGAIPSGWNSFFVEGSDHRAIVARWDLCTDAPTAPIRHPTKDRG